MPVKKAGMYYIKYLLPSSLVCNHTESHHKLDSGRPGNEATKVVYYSCRILQGEGSSMKIIDSLIETFNMIKSNFPNFVDKPIFNE